MEQEMKQVTLAAWGSTAFSPPLSLWTVRKMAKEGRIDPQPVKIGRTYYVQEDARPMDPNRKPTLAERLKKAN